MYIEESLDHSSSLLGIITSQSVIGVESGNDLLTSPKDNIEQDNKK